MRHPPSPALVLWTAVQVACSTAVIALASTSLQAGGRCWLSGDAREPGPCGFAIGTGVFSISLAVLAGCLRCASFDCCGLGPIQSILLAGLNSVWWLVASAVLTAWSAAADSAGMPHAPERRALLCAAWAAALAELLHSAAACLAVGNRVCNLLFCVPEVPHDGDCCAGCCAGCCCCRRRGRGHGHGHDEVHAALVPSPAAAAVAAAATAAWWRRASWAAQPQPQPAPHAQQPAAAWHAGAAGPPPQAGMPPPPTAGQPYTFAPAGAGSGVATGTPVGQPSGGAFSGFAPPPPPGFAGGTPTAVGFCAAPPAPQPQQQPAAAYAPPVVVRMPPPPSAPPVQQPQPQGAAGPAYPPVPKQ